MLIYPDYKKSIINITSSVMKYYRKKYAYPTLNELDEYLDKFYKNVVVLAIDGMGDNILKKNLSNISFLAENKIKTVTSVFPSSQSASTVSFLTGVSPNEHAWLGKSLYLKEISRTIDSENNTDYYTKQSISTTSNILEFIMPYDTIFGAINKSVIDNVQSFSISSAGDSIVEDGNFHKTAKSFEDGFEILRKIANTNQNTFTFFKWNALYETINKYGCYAKETEDKLHEINDVIKSYTEKFTDTLFIITAGTGATDISETLMIERFKEIKDSLIIPPFVEGRCFSFFVKQEYKNTFENMFYKNFNHDFMLISRKNLYAKNLMGFGNSHPKITDFVGDFIAVAISDKYLRYNTLNGVPKYKKTASNGGLTDDEMIVPLIVVETEQTKEFYQKRIL